MKKRLHMLLALGLCALLILSALAGCGAKSMASDTAASDGNGSWNESAPDSPMEAPSMTEMEDAADAELATGISDVEEDMSQTVDFTQKIIYSGHLSVETTEFDAAVAAIDRLVGELGGFVESSDVSGYTSYQPDGSTRVVDRYASYLLRVPSGKFQSAMSQAGAIGNVTSYGTNTENITSQYIDQEARRDSLEVQEERLLTMLEKSEDVETLVTLESRLSEVRYEIESIERQLRNWQMQVDYSTISLDLREVAVYTPTATVQRTFGEKMSDAFSDGWSGFVRGLQNFAMFLARSLPGLVIFAALVIAVIVIIRRFCRSRAVRRTKDHLPPDDKPEA